LELQNQIRLSSLSICVYIAFLQGCGGVRLQTPGELGEQIKKGGQYDSEKRCDQYPYRSIEFQNCREEVRKVYDELERKRKADGDNSKGNMVE
jgi:hypothetical protein